MIPPSEISHTGAWMTKNSEGHVHDHRLCEELKLFLKNKSVLDMGCGMGDYTRSLSETCSIVKGVDGNPNTPMLTNGLCTVQDFTEDFDMGQFDWVMCLEVGEHIPANYQQTLINNIVKHSKEGVILSWAIPGQGGDGHVNCLKNEDVIEIMKNESFAFDEQATNRLRKSVSNAFWFLNTILVFNKV